MKEAITIRIPKELRSDLERLSRSENIAISDLVRKSIQYYVALYRFRALRNKVLPFAEAQGLLTDEDIFKAVS